MIAAHCNILTRKLKHTITLNMAFAKKMEEVQARTNTVISSMQDPDFGAAQSQLQVLADLTELQSMTGHESLGNIVEKAMDESETHFSRFASKKLENTERWTKKHEAMAEASVASMLPSIHLDTASGSADQSWRDPGDCGEGLTIGPSQRPPLPIRHDSLDLSRRPRHDSLDSSPKFEGNGPRRPGHDLPAMPSGMMDEASGAVNHEDPDSEMPSEPLVKSDEGTSHASREPPTPVGRQGFKGKALPHRRPSACAPQTTATASLGSDMACDLPALNGGRRPSFRSNEDVTPQPALDKRGVTMPHLSSSRSVELGGTPNPLHATNPVDSPIQAKVKADMQRQEVKSARAVLPSPQAHTAARRPSHQSAGLHHEVVAAKGHIVHNQSSGFHHEVISTKPSQDFCLTGSAPKTSLS